MATYGNPHTLAPTTCASNTVTFTDATLTANSIKPRKVHIDELRTAINNELSRRGLSTVSFTDSTVTANVTQVRKIHIDELRTAINKIHTGDCSGDTYYCPQDALTSSTDFTDGTITTNVTEIRNLHISEIRTKISTLMSSCICESEQCQYCADCGYQYSACNHADCACDDQGSSQCSQHSSYTVYSCGSVNLASSTTHPYKASSGNNTGTAWDGTVPWTMGTTPPGISWSTCEFAGGHNHSAWNCKCSPHTWG